MLWRDVWRVREDTNKGGRGRQSLQIGGDRRAEASKRIRCSPGRPWGQGSAHREQLEQRLGKPGIQTVRSAVEAPDATVRTGLYWHLGRAPEGFSEKLACVIRFFWCRETLVYTGMRKE